MFSLGIGLVRRGMVLLGGSGLGCLSLWCRVFLLWRLRLCLFRCSRPSSFRRLGTRHPTCLLSFAMGGGPMRSRILGVCC